MFISAFVESSSSQGCPLQRQFFPPPPVLLECSAKNPPTKPCVEVKSLCTRKEKEPTTLLLSAMHSTVMFSYAKRGDR